MSMPRYPVSTLAGVLDKVTKGVFEWTVTNRNFDWIQAHSTCTNSDGRQVQQERYVRWIVLIEDDINLCVDWHTIDHPGLSPSVNERFQCLVGLLASCLSVSTLAGSCSLARTACSIIGRIRRAMYSANLRAAGEMVLGVSVLVDARVLLA